MMFKFLSKKTNKIFYGALNYIAKGNFLAAEKIFEKLITKTNADEELNYYYYALCLFENGKINEALENINKALQKDNNFYAAYILKGLIFAEIWKNNTEENSIDFLKEAIFCYTKALLLKPNDIDAQEFLIYLKNCYA